MPLLLKEQVNAAYGSTTQDIDFVTSVDILPNEDVLFAVGRNAAAAIAGSTSVTLSGSGAGTFEVAAGSIRASTIDVSISRFRVTSRIPAGSTITLHCASSSVKGAAIMQVVSGLASASANATSGKPSLNQLGNTNSGPNGTTSSTETAATTAATTVNDCLVLFVGGVQGMRTMTPGAGYTQLGYATSTVGSGDRGLSLEYKIVSSKGVQTETADISSSQVWAAAIAAFEIDTSAPPVTHPDYKEWNGTAWVTLTPKEWNGTAWVILTPKEL